MDGDKYSKEIINHIKILSNLPNNDENLCTKRKTCILINGQSQNEHISSKWNRSLDSDNPDIVFKPQFFHSSAAIFLLIKYPHFRPSNSFITIIIKSNLMDECLKMATDVLMADLDGIDFVKNSDLLFSDPHKIRIVDEINNSVTDYH